MSADEPPDLYVVAGPNGSGKSTLIQALHSRLALPVIDPDALALELRPQAREQAAISAARLALRQQQAFLARRTGFILETTLSGNHILHLMDQARQRGFSIHMVFVCVDTVEGNIARITERVARGGHYVPDGDVRRRYERSLPNLPAALALADDAQIFDNSTVQGPREVATWRAGAIVGCAGDLPTWVTTALAALLPKS